MWSLSSRYWPTVRPAELHWRGEETKSYPWWWSGCCVWGKEKTYPCDRDGFVLLMEIRRQKIFWVAANKSQAFLQKWHCSWEAPIHGQWGSRRVLVTALFLVWGTRDWLGVQKSQNQNVLRDHCITDTHFAEEITEKQRVSTSLKVTLVPVSKMRVYPLPQYTFPCNEMGKWCTIIYHSWKVIGIFHYLTYFLLRDIKLFHQHWLYDCVRHWI